MTAGPRDHRADAISADAISAGDVLAVLEALAAGPAVRGHEFGAARQVAAVLADRWPELDWRVLPADGDGADLSCSATVPAVPVGSAVGSTGEPSDGGLLVYSHLDTSLTGDPVRDLPISGRAEPAAALRVDGGTVHGPGLAVARGPAAAAAVGFAAAARRLAERGTPHRTRLLLAGGGTHASSLGDVARSRSGAERLLAHGPRPAAAVVAKCGPFGVLHGEPGAMYLRIRVGTEHGAVMARNAARPPGGLLRHVGVLVDAVEAWRLDHLRARLGGSGQLGAEVGIGALRSGSPAKADLLPGRLDLHLYVVLLPSDDPAAIAADLRERLVGALAATPLRDAEVDVAHDPVAPGGHTAPDHPVVRAAWAAWRRHHDRPPDPIRGWTGSTDGALLRAAGIPTARVGPVARRAVDDPRRDRFEVVELVGYAQLYADLVCGFWSRIVGVGDHIGGDQHGT